MLRINHFINGEFVIPHGEDYKEKRSPNDGKVLAEVANGGREDAKRGIDAAYESHKSWSKLPPIKRAEYLSKFLEIYKSSVNTFQEYLIREAGGIKKKAWAETLFTERLISNAIEVARHVNGENIPSDSEGQLNIVFKKPKGVTSVITPWNYPLSISIKKVMHSLAFGNTVVLKTSSETPMTGYLIADVAQKSLPKGVLNVIFGSGSVVGDEMVTNKKVSHITFTGETVTGKEIASKAGGNLKSVTLELGGSDPLIIMDDVDIDYATRLAVFGAFFHQGQICTSSKRILVHERIYDRFVSRFMEAVNNLVVGDPELENTDIGPLINERQVSAMQEFVKDSQDRGGKIISGGKFKENYFYPTVVTDVDANFKIMKEEVFGPVRPVVRFSTKEEAIDIANSTEYGLSGAVLTNNINTALFFVENVEAGMFHVNDVTFLEESHIPFGGIKSSGLGREGGLYSARETMYDKWVTFTTRTKRFPIPASLKEKTN
ncbi:aldehyde dehydrogenase [Sulfolobales archaeon HS-7]|nr:aldehyde dehydrogenase [Sulfolobales archaeon HS-7]